MSFKIKDYIFTTSEIGSGISHILRNLTDTDIIGEAIIFLLLICVKRYLDWEADSSFFLVFLFALFYWNLDFRISIGLALLCLTACPFVLLLGSISNVSAAENVVEQLATWTYYFLVIGFAKQAWDLWKQNQKEDRMKKRKLLSAGHLKTITGAKGK